MRVAIRDGVIAGLFDHTDIPVLYSHINANEPITTYVVVYIDTTDQLASANVSGLTNTDLELTIVASYEVKTQLSFVGKDSGTISYDFLQNIKNNPIVRENLQRKSLNISSASSVRRAPQKREGNWVEYHNMNVTFTYSAISQQLVDIVESVDVIATVIVGNETTSESYSVPPTP